MYQICFRKGHLIPGLFGVRRLITPSSDEQETASDHDNIAEEDDIDVEIKEEVEDEAAVSRTSSKSQFANFSVLSLLARKTPEKETNKLEVSFWSSHNK